MYKEFLSALAMGEGLTQDELEARYNQFFGALAGRGLTREAKLREIQEWSAAGQKAPVCAKKRKLDPNLDQKKGTLWLFGRRPDILNQPVKEKRGVDQGGKEGPLVTPM